MKQLFLPLPYAFWIFALALTTYFVASTVYSWHRLRKFSGPRLAGFSWLWVLNATASGRLAWIYEDMAAKYGHLVRVGPNLLLTDDLDLLRKMSAARSPYGKDGAYGATIRHPEHHSMLSSMDLVYHDDIKAKLAGPYGGRETTTMEPVVDEMVGALTSYLRKHASTDDEKKLPVPIDFNKVVEYFTVDIITRVSFGQELGCLATDSDVHGLLAAITKAMKVYTIPLSVPWLRDITTSATFQKYFAPKVTDKGGMGVMMRVAQEGVNKRYGPDAPDEKDLLGAFVRAGLNTGPCLSEVLVAMIAGKDTTAASIRMTMLCLMTNPRVYNKLKGIVREAIRDGTASNPIKQQEAKKIPYLQAVIFEGLRMRPPAPVMLGKVVPPEGDTVLGQFIPGGTVIAGINTPMMKYSKYWGDDADVFRPERFMEADGETRASLERIVDMAFGFGRLKCAGQPLAYMELNKVFFELFRNFDFEVVNPLKPWNPEFYTAWRDWDFLVQITDSGIM